MLTCTLILNKYANPPIVTLFTSVIMEVIQMSKAKSRSKGLSVSFAIEFRKGVRKILELRHLTQNELSDMVGIQRQSLSLILTRDDYRITGLQFMGIMMALRLLIDDDAFFDTYRDVKKAESIWLNLKARYLLKGFE